MKHAALIDEKDIIIHRLLGRNEFLEARNTQLEYEAAHLEWLLHQAAEEGSTVTIEEPVLH